MKNETQAYQEASSYYLEKLKERGLRAIYENAKIQKKRRKESRLYPLIKKYGVENIHKGLMERFDFWEIFPVEGKYAMAV